MNHFAMLLFYLLSALTIASAALVVLSRKATYGVLALAAGMLCLAGLYILLEAYFVAVIQVLIYAGAILVLFLFVVMLMGIAGVDLGLRQSPVRLGLCVALGIVFVVELWIAISAAHREGWPGGGMAGTVETIGRALFSEYLLPFELVSGVLLIGILGVVGLAQKELKRHS